MSDHLTVDLGAPLARLVTSNQHHGQHWGSTFSEKVLWRDGMTVLARQHHLKERVAGRHAVVRFTFPVPDRRRRDPSNLIGTVVKWCVDGLVNAGVWPDDDPRFVSVMESLLTPDSGRVTLELWVNGEG